MKFRKGFLFVIALSVTLLPNISQAAPVVSQEISQLSGYQYAEDPFLLDWTFRIEGQENQLETKELSFEEKTLARWKTKQAHLWEQLPAESFTMNASAYTAAADECGKNDGVTASGLKVAEKRTLACPANYPFGTTIRIEGMGDYRCEDRGGAIKGNKFDIYMETKAEAFGFGRQHLVAQVIR